MWRGVGDRLPVRTRVSPFPLLMVWWEVSIWSSVLSNHSITRNSLEMILRTSSDLPNQIWGEGRQYWCFFMKVWLMYNIILVWGI